MKWILLAALALAGCQLPVDSGIVPTSGGGCDVSFKQGRFNKLTVDDLIVTHEINQGLMQQVQSSSRAIGQLNATGFLGDLYVRGQVYQGLGSQWAGPIANPFGATAIYSIAFGNNVFVAVGVGGTISRSTDYGVTWSALIGNNFVGQNILAIAYGNGVFVATSIIGTISRSTDYGVTWSALIANSFGGSGIGSISFGNNVFVAVSNSGKISRSTDNGATWSALLGNPFLNRDLYSVAFGYGIFIAAGDFGQIGKSSDLGLTWGSLITNPFGGLPIEQLGFGNNVFVAVGDSGRIARSITFGTTWGSLISNPFGASNIWSVGYNFGIFQVGGASGKTARSYDDGLTWGSLVTNPFGANIIRCISSNPQTTPLTGNMIAVGDGGSIATSGWSPAYSLVEPVPGEPSIGTLHLFNYDGTSRLVVNAATGAASWSAAVACSGHVPVGAKAVLAEVFVRTGSGAAGQVQLEFAFGSGTGTVPAYNTFPTADLDYNAAGASAVFADSHEHLTIPLDTSRQFYYYRTINVNTNVIALYVILLGYYS